MNRNPGLILSNSNIRLFMFKFLVLIGYSSNIHNEFLGIKMRPRCSFA